MSSLHEQNVTCMQHIQQMLRMPHVESNAGTPLRANNDGLLNARVYALPILPVNSINKPFETSNIISIVHMKPLPGDNRTLLTLDPESEQVRKMELLEPVLVCSTLSTCSLLIVFRSARHGC